MTPEEKQLLEKTFELEKENNKILHKMLRIARLGQIVRIIYWVVIVGSAIGAIYYVQPYVEAVFGTYLQLGAGIGDISDSTSNIKGLLGI